VTYEPPLDARQLLVRVGAGWELRDRGGSVWAFHADGRLGWVRDRFGNGVAVRRDAAGHPTALRDGNGREVALTVDAGLVREVVDFTGHRWTYDYVDDLLVRVELPATQTSRPASCATATPAAPTRAPGPTWRPSAPRRAPS
jgi:hypothetical protein